MGPPRRGPWGGGGQPAAVAGCVPAGPGRRWPAATGRRFVGASAESGLEAAGGAGRRGGEGRREVRRRWLDGKAPDKCEKEGEIGEIKRGEKIGRI